MHTDSVRTGQRVLLVDDLIATGGTMLAAIKLLQRLGANVVEAAAIIDLPDLGGSAKVAATGTPLYTVCQYGDATPAKNSDLQRAKPIKQRWVLASVSHNALAA
ncbi:hypothetical protein G6F57_022683 [Rhizopus arrhizus]|nr:hypothetical protein G6F57_022683 [Rhizopus arrhizus]